MTINYNNLTETDTTGNYDELDGIRRFLEIAENTPHENRNGTLRIFQPCQKCSNKSTQSSICSAGIDSKTLCDFTDRTYDSLIKAQHNIMPVNNNVLFSKLSEVWCRIITKMGNTKSPEQHFCGALIQSFPSIMLQKAGKSTKCNFEALEKRLGWWEAGDLVSLITDFENIQTSLSHKPTRPKTATRNTTENSNVVQAVNAVENGNMRLAANILDPNKLGLLPWSESVEQKLKDSFTEDDDPVIFSNIPSNQIPTSDIIRVTDEDIKKP